MMRGGYEQAPARIAIVIPCLDNEQEMTFGWSLEMLTKTGESKRRVINVPVTWSKRTGGTSWISGDIKKPIDIGRHCMASLYRRCWR